MNHPPVGSSISEKYCTNVPFHDLRATTISHFNPKHTTPALSKHFTWAARPADFHLLIFQSKPIENEGEINFIPSARIDQICHSPENVLTTIFSCTNTYRLVSQVPKIIMCWMCKKVSHNRHSAVAFRSRRYPPPLTSYITLYIADVSKNKSQFHIQYYAHPVNLTQPLHQSADECKKYKK